MTRGGQQKWDFKDEGILVLAQDTRVQTYYLCLLDLPVRRRAVDRSFAWRGGLTLQRPPRAFVPMRAHARARGRATAA